MTPEDIRQETLDAVFAVLDGVEFDFRVQRELHALKARLTAPAKSVAPLEEKVDYTTETVVQFHIKPPLDKERWKALYDAARVAGAFYAHLNPPNSVSAARQRDQPLEKGRPKWR